MILFRFKMIACIKIVIIEFKIARFKMLKKAKSL